MLLKRPAHVENIHRRPRTSATRPEGAARLRARRKTRETGQGMPLFVAAFSLSLLTGGGWLAKSEIDKARAEIARLSSYAASLDCDTDTMASRRDLAPRFLASAASPAFDGAFLVSQSPLFSTDRID